LERHLLSRASKVQGCCFASAHPNKTASFEHSNRPASFSFGGLVGSQMGYFFLLEYTDLFPLTWAIWYKCSRGVMLGWFSTGLEIAITMFNKKDHNLFSSFEVIVNFQMQESLPTHIQRIGQPISNHWEMRTWVKLVFFSRNLKPCPFNLLIFHHVECDG
jgi:hypothetical protein